MNINRDRYYKVRRLIIILLQAIRKVEPHEKINVDEQIISYEDKNHCGSSLQPKKSKETRLLGTRTMKGKWDNI